MSVEHLYSLQEYRNIAGMELYKGGHVSMHNGIFKVHSATFPDQYYEVDVEYPKCSCPDFHKRGRLLKCKHLVAAKLFIEKPVY